MDPEHSGQQGGGEVSYVPAGNSSSIRNSGFRSSSGNKATHTGSHGSRGGLEIKVVHTHIRTGM